MSSSACISLRCSGLSTIGNPVGSSFTARYWHPAQIALRTAGDHFWAVSLAFSGRPLSEVVTCTMSLVAHGRPSDRGDSDDEHDGSPDVRARRADRRHPVLG